MCLVGPVCAAEPLDGSIRLPARLKQIVNPQAAIPGRQLGMVRTSCTSGIAEDEDALGVIHECRGLGEVRRRGTVLDDEADAVADDAAGAPGHLRHHVRPEPLHDLIEGARHW